MSKMTVERLDELLSYFSDASDLKFRDVAAALNLAKLALSPPQDGAALVSELRKNAPHVPAAFINAIREEGTKQEACDWLQKEWNEKCALADALTALSVEQARDKKRIAELEAGLKPFARASANFDKVSENRELWIAMRTHAFHSSQKSDPDELKIKHLRRSAELLEQQTAALKGGEQ